jgi:predicted glycosyltransferase
MRHKTLELIADHGSDRSDGQGWQSHAALPSLNIAFYSHDTMGLGHIRRNMYLADILLRAYPGSNALLLTGSHQASRLAAHPRMDFLVVPAVCKQINGAYQSRKLAISLGQLTAIRSSVIKAGLLAFRPDVLIVDNVPRGLEHELDETLAALRAGGQTRLVLGLRDILDTPQRIQSQWRRRRNLQAIEQYYDAIWVYGDRAVYDLGDAYALPDSVRRRLHYTGYFDRLAASYEAATDWDCDPALEGDGLDGPVALCLLGGGQDGGLLAETVAAARRPPGMHMIVVTGPYMPTEVRQRLDRRAALDPGLHIMEFHPEPKRLLQQAERVIAMGGYNTISEILSFPCKRALIVPRVRPRLEQLIRAKYMSRLGLFDMCHPRRLTPERIGAWLAEDHREPRQARDIIAFDGSTRLPKLLHTLLNSEARRDTVKLMSGAGWAAVED